MAPTAARRPLIGVTCGSVTTAAGARRIGTSPAYTEAVSVGGGVAVLVPPSEGSPLELLERLDGLLLTGGADVHPRFYGAQLSDLVGRTDELRDQTELALVAAARERGLPVLGICRGLQLINVAFGGSLVQDIATEIPGHLEHRTPPELGRGALAHEVALAPGSWFASATGAANLQVNSLHHQAAAAPGAGLKVTATSADGVIEGLEGDDGRTLAIQCHAEELLASEWARSLFRSFVRLAG